MPAKQDDVRVCFERVRARPVKVALLIGAGCSATAGVPVASELVAEVRKRYPFRCARLCDEERYKYNKVVAELAADEWAELFREIEKGAGVNLAHLCIAELMRIGIVDRVLTTNFDTLLPRACALAGVHPAIFDCVASPGLRRVVGDEEPAIYYLHGQAYGLRMISDEKDLADHGDYVREIVQQSVERRTLIVCGYSGLCDGVLEWLRDRRDLRNPVFWVPFSHGDADRVTVQFEGKKPVFVLENYGADEFFCNLLRHLEKDPPLVLRDISSFTERIRNLLRLPMGFSVDRWTAAAGVNCEPTTQAQSPSDSVPVPGPPAGAEWAGQTQL